MKSGDPEGKQEGEYTNDTNIIAYKCNSLWWSLRHNKGVSNDGENLSL